LRACIDALGLEKTVAIEYIKPDDREGMSETLGQASVVAVLSDYESHPLVVMEALTLGIPVAGLDTAGIGDLVRDKLVRGVPKDASPPAVAQILVAALQDGRANVFSRALPTWDAAAIDLAHVYRDAVGATLRAPCP
jgi:glycosyltransferase involved in cell wall biosynthesis